MPHLASDNRMWELAVGSLASAVNFDRYSRRGTVLSMTALSLAKVSNYLGIDL